PAALCQVPGVSMAAVWRAVDDPLRTSHAHARPEKPTPVHRTASPGPHAALWSDSSFAQYPSCWSTTRLHANLHGFAGTLLKVVGRALRQCFKCASIQMKMANWFFAFYLNGVDIIGQQGDARPRLHDYGFFLNQFSLARLAAIVRTTIYKIVFNTFDRRDTGPCSVVVWNDFLARQHDVQIQRIAMIRVFVNHVARLEFAIGWRWKRFGVPQRFICSERNQLIQHLSHLIAIITIGRRNFSYVFQGGMSCCLSLSGYGHQCNPYLLFGTWLKTLWSRSAGQYKLELWINK